MTRDFHFLNRVPFFSLWGIWKVGSPISSSSADVPANTHWEFYAQAPSFLIPSLPPVSLLLLTIPLFLVLFLSPLLSLPVFLPHTHFCLVFPPSGIKFKPWFKGSEDSMCSKYNHTNIFKYCTKLVIISTETWSWLGECTQSAHVSNILNSVLRLWTEGWTLKGWIGATKILTSPLSFPGLLFSPTVDISILRKVLETYVIRIRLPRESCHLMDIAHCSARKKLRHQTSDKSHQLCSMTSPVLHVL